MNLWIPVFALLWQLRPAFPRTTTFVTFVAAVLGFCTRTDCRGVTSLVRALGLKTAAYDAFLRVFHCPSLDPGRLFDAWTRIVFRSFKGIVKHGDRPILVADGLKVPKEARKMPGVKSLHQESSNNSKPEWIMGHYFQTIAVLVEGLGRFFAVPLSSRIHEGLKSTPREKRTLIDKLLLELFWLPVPRPFILVADSYYSAAIVMLQMVRSYECDLVSQVRMNAVARLEAPARNGRRGRPAKYGTKVKLVSYFDGVMCQSTVKVYGQASLGVSYWCKDLLWPALGARVRFVGTVFPGSKRAILMTTDLSLPPERVIELYAMRMRVEQSFKVSVRQLGAYASHFRCKTMKRIKRCSKGQYLHRWTKEYRTQMLEKLASCERFVFTGLVAQGVLQYLAVSYPGHIADLAYAFRVHPNIRIGYGVWARPLAKLVRRSRVLQVLLRPLILAWGAKMAGRPTRVGSALKAVGEPICFVIGSVVRAADLVLGGCHGRTV